MAKDLRLSVSKMTTYEGCPFAYYLKYERHEKVVEPVVLTFGKTVHRMLDIFYDKNYKSEDSFANSFVYEWFAACSGDRLKGKAREGLKVKEYPNLKDPNKDPLRLSNHIQFGWDESKIGDNEIFWGYLSSGKAIMKKFYNQYKGKEAPFLKEKSYTLDIEGHTGKKHRVIVIFDRIDEREDGSLIISDYKTDKTSPGENQGKSVLLHRHPQFTLYSLAFRQLIEEGRIVPKHGGTKEDALFFHHVRSGKMFKTHRSEKDFDYIRTVLDKVSSGIELDRLTKRFTPLYGYHCNGCMYKVPCQKYSVDHGGPRIDLEGRIKTAHEVEWDYELPGDASWLDKDIETLRASMPLEKSDQQWLPGIKEHLIEDLTTGIKEKPKKLKKTGQKRFNFRKKK